MRIKMGPIEIDYEGSEDFLKQELPAILTAVSTLHKESGLVEDSPAGASSRSFRARSRSGRGRSSRSSRTRTGFART